MKEMKERLELHIRRVLFFGLLFSLLLTISGGLFYLSFYGKNDNDYQIFQNEPKVSTTTKIWQDISSFSARGVIQLGILSLVLTQLLRISLVAWYYFRLHDPKFCWLSLFILSVLIYSLFWTL